MISVDLALSLKRSGLRWEPQIHDRFAIPDRDLDGKTFALNDLSTEIHEFADRAAITFNGAVEWSLDWILSEEVVWLPTETQLRESLGNCFVGLDGIPGGYRCRVRLGSADREFDAATGDDAYGRALLAVLEDGRACREEAAG